MSEKYNTNSPSDKSDLKKTVYVSGPMTGRSDWNRKAFYDAHRLLESQGYNVINPFEINPEEDHANNRAACMARDLKALESCDAIYLLQGYQHSKGAQEELSKAKRLGLTVLYQPPDNNDKIN